ncbi:hypothetical protein GUITHDRAFT_155681 [Guillardia theta CCMP2712]|uniref:Serine aminopeptidase S33 domain-containing protein n=1 Tax=Guillardia theta (strain CCMP2712) TaxID=905079 RepID=L1IEX0_GUITC|nr:hypothetical protein GUITHDRAFT_155681 [Guillardia theta CCMP2712]EKX34642.1 hypothetical protein GUITHDRAFT_155681 [Guillardia theta CCMP2712]|eukprot:XP_005821622.1 hypothetical protein GUITHDRAFT_155681 [Guillardia theta CCMP2712]
MATTEPEKIVVSAHDGHEISLWKKGPANGKPIVLLHGRTWSARPVWDLQVGSPPRDGASYLGANTMDLMASRGWLVFAPDFRGLGGTKRDEEGWTTPNKCVSDVLAVLDYLAKEGHQKPPLVGWSQGALIAQLIAQKHADRISQLVLYGSIFDKDVVYSPPSKEDYNKPPPYIANTMEGAMEDWTVPGIIDDEAAQAFGDEALKWDPRKVSWSKLDEFNACRGEDVHVPTLVIHGEKDTYTSIEKQKELFLSIASMDKAWRIIPGCDHPVHLYPAQRLLWLSSITSFLERDHGKN